MVKTFIETITPNVASEYLAKSGGNRQISDKVVLKYAKQMEKGEWMLNGESIKFDNGGKLIDGHHRLYACVKANTPFQSIVMRGIEPECFTTFDCGRHRTLGQLISMGGGKHYNTIASGVQVCFRLEFYQSLTEHGGSIDMMQCTNTRLMEYYHENKELFDESARMTVGILSNIRLLTPSFVTGSIAYLTKIGGYEFDEVCKFFSEVCSLENTDSLTIELLRKRLIHEKTNSTRKTSIFVISAMVIKTWNSYVTNKPLKCIKFNPSKETYPKYIFKSELNNQLFK